MNDLISREKLLKWAKSFDNETYNYLLIALNASENDFSPDSPYKPGDMILVREDDPFPWLEREFVSMHKNQKWVWCLGDKEDYKALLWKQHKPIPKTVTVELPVELISDLKKIGEHFQHTNSVKRLLKLIADQVD